VTPLSKTIVYLFGAGLVVLGVGLLISGGLTLPTRSPPVRFHFSGASLVLLGGGPLVLGVTLIALARGNVAGSSRTLQLAIGVGIGLLGLAFAVVAKG
jgi:hypothetical protein